MSADIYLMVEHDRRGAEVDIVAKREAYYGHEHNFGHARREEYLRLEQEYRRAIDYIEETSAFHDNYDQTCLAWMCGLSYWKEAHLRDEDGCFPLDAMERWLEVIKNTDMRAAVRKAIENGEHNGPMYVGGRPLPERLRPEYHLGETESEEKVVEMFKRKQEKFVALLERATIIGERLHWSV
jgi:hypothetical protein